MGGALQPGGALSNRRARRGTRAPMSEIDLTPMVGVVLVLLIIFMVTAPLMTVGVEIGADTSQARFMTPGTAPLIITIEADGKITLQNTEIGFDDLGSQLAALREAGGVPQVWLRGAKGAAYGDVARVLVRVRQAGLPVTLLTDQAGPR